MNIIIVSNILLLSTIGFAQIDDVEEIDYYEELITEEIIKSLSYQMPNNSKYFAENLTSSEIHDFGECDFIIVGAGSAGSVIANRLSEVRQWKILLLEAGKYETDFNDIPALYVPLAYSEMNWGYKTTPQKESCLGMPNRQFPYPRGKVLGGSSSINNNVYVRGNPLDFDNWEAQGNPGWSYENVLPYFLKSENSKIDGDLGYHNVGGLLHVEYPEPFVPLISTYFEANEELGLEILDYNGRNQLGVGRTQFNMINGRRDSGAKAFLEPVFRRDNLKIVTGALVYRIVINQATKEAEGVQFILNGVLYEAWANKEVIVSAGAIGSPQLLLLSGIGSKDEITKHGLVSVQDLPGVGENLQDHPHFTGIIAVINEAVPTRPFRTYVEEYLNGRGPLTYPAALAVASILTDNSILPGAPAIQLGFIPPSDPNMSAPLNILDYNMEVLEKIYLKLPLNRSILLPTILLHPRSRGTVKLRNKDPLEFPDIDLNLLSDPRDVETIYQGILYLLKLIKTEAFQKYDATLLQYSLSACKDLGYLSKAYWICHIKHLTRTIYHPVGTCKMGPSSDPQAVVNYQLKVHGIGGLRVADCSIMPQITSGNTNAPAYMIGEKASDMIKEMYS